MARLEQLLEFVSSSNKEIHKCEEFKRSENRKNWADWSKINVKHAWEELEILKKEVLHMRSDIESCVKLGVNIQQKFPNTYAVIDYYTRLLRNAQEGLGGCLNAVEQRCSAVEKHSNVSIENINIHTYPYA